MSIAGKTTSDGRNVKAPQTPRRGVLGWIVGHPKLTAFGVLLLMAIGSCELFDMRAEQAFQHELDAIRASGSPVTLDDLNAVMCDVPDDENAAILMEAPAKVIAAKKLSEEHRKVIPFVGEGPLPSCGERMQSEQREAAEVYLVAVEQPLAKLHEAIKHERGYRKTQWTSPAVDCALSADYNGDRRASTTLHLAARMAAEAGDRDAVYQRVCDLAALDHALDGDGGWLRILLRIAIRELALDALAESLNLSGLDDAQLADIPDAFNEPDWIAAGRRAMEVERVLMLDTVQWSFTSRSPAGNVPAPPSYLRFIPIVRAAGNAKGLQMWQGYVDAFDAPESGILLHMQLTEKGMRGLPSYCLLWKFTASSFSRGTALLLQQVASQRAMIAALACERYRLANGDWPESLDVLVPTYLGVVPLDPFDAKPIRYKPFEHGITVYSIGEDQRDGGGDVKHRDINKPNKRPTDAGYVLLNPELRNREPAADDTKDESTDGEE